MQQSKNLNIKISFVVQIILSTVAFSVGMYNVYDVHITFYPKLFLTLCGLVVTIGVIYFGTKVLKKFLVEKTLSLAYIITSLIMTALMLFLFPLINLVNTNNFFLNGIALLGVCIICFNIFLIFVSFPVLKFGFGSFDISIKNKISLGFGLLFFLFSSTMLLIYFPGIYSNDSIEQINQGITMKLDDWHPVVHTLLIKLFTSINGSPILYIIFQLIGMATIFAYATEFLIRIKTDKFLVILYMIVTLFNPISLIFSITIWKDVPFGALMLLLSILCAEIYYTKGLCLKNRMFFGVFLLTLIFTPLIRHNGIIPAIALLFVAGFFYRKQVLRLVIALIILVITIYGVKPYVFNQMDVVKPRAFQSLVNQVMQVAAIVHNDGEITDEEKSVITQLLPMVDWKESYKKYSEVPIASNKNFNSPYLEKNKVNFLKAWAGMAMRNPNLALKGFIDRTSIVWRVKAYDDMTLYTNLRMIADNKLNIKLNSKFIKGKNVVDIFYKVFDLKFIQWTLWSPALYIYLTLSVIIGCLIKRKTVILLVVLPVVINTLALFAVTTAPQTRYFYSVILLLPFLIAFGNRMSQKEEDTAFETN